MCGRYYMDEETYLDIQKIVSEVEVSFGRDSMLTLICRS